jgi:hypothetical protein
LIVVIRTAAGDASDIAGAVPIARRADFSGLFAIFCRSHRLNAANSWRALRIEVGNFRQPEKSSLANKSQEFGRVMMYHRTWRAG